MNDGFVLEEHRLIDVNNIAGGTVPFRRRYQSPVDLRTRQAEDRDIAIYVQDSWRPHPRLSLNLGVRADFVKRNDILFDITRQNSTEIGPRFGFSYQVTSDARTILRGSAVRVHEQVMGRDAITLFGANEAAADVNIYDRTATASSRRRKPSPRRPGPRRSPTTSSPTICTSPTSTSSSWACAASSPGS